VRHSQDVSLPPEALGHVLINPFSAGFPNGYLEGRIPASMTQNPDKIIEAARQDMAERW